MHLAYFIRCMLHADKGRKTTRCFIFCGAAGAEAWILHYVFLIFAAVCVCMCAGAVFVVQYLARRHLCEVSQISEASAVSRAHTRTLKGEALCAASLAEANKHMQGTRAANSTSAYFCTFICPTTHIHSSQQPHLPFKYKECKF